MSSDYFREADLERLDAVVLQHHQHWKEAFGATTMTSNSHKLLHIVEQIRIQGTIHDMSVCIQMFTYIHWNY